jgi:hypothetical protein
MNAVSPPGADKPLTGAYVREQLDYDPNTGLLWWREPKKGRQLYRPAGVISTTTGYRYITLDYVNYPAAKLVWLWATDEWIVYPRELDHMDGDEANDRIENLEPVTRSLNVARAWVRRKNAS